MLESRIRASVLAGLTLLIVAVAVWILTPVPSPLRVVWVAVITLPVWILMPALRRGERRRYALLTLCLVPYLVLALTEVIANPPARIAASAMLLFAFSAFVLAILYLRVTRPLPEPKPATDA
jgi:uncharacterized membrane protein